VVVEDVEVETLVEFCVLVEGALVEFCVLVDGMVGELCVLVDGADDEGGTVLEVVATEVLIVVVEVKVFGGVQSVLPPTPAWFGRLDQPCGIRRVCPTGSLFQSTAGFALDRLSNGQPKLSAIA
jgi:hypothetical protein